MKHLAERHGVIAVLFEMLRQRDGIRNRVTRSHTFVVSGRSPVMMLTREGLQTASWQYARSNSTPDDARRSICGV